MQQVIIFLVDLQFYMSQSHHLTGQILITEKIILNGMVQRTFLSTLVMNGNQHIVADFFNKREISQFM